MIFGMSLATYTMLHVAISLTGIFSGFIVLIGLLTKKRMNGWTAVFLTSTVVTSVTAFGFPFTHLLPSHKLAIISLVVIAIAILARYAFIWPERGGTYVITGMIALYLNVFVLVVQSFEKVPALKALAPTQSERPFVVTQLVVLTAFVLLIILAVGKFGHEQHGAVSVSAKTRKPTIRSCRTLPAPIRTTHPGFRRFRMSRHCLHHPESAYPAFAGFGVPISRAAFPCGAALFVVC